jgi:WXG100 family type VII secretion target
MPDIESSHIQVPASLAAAPGILTGRAQQLQDELEALAAKISPLHETWTGGSGTAYTDVSQLWNTDATALFDPETGLLKQIANALQVVIENYDLAESTNVRTWRTF